MEVTGHVNTSLTKWTVSLGVSLILPPVTAPAAPPLARLRVFFCCWVCVAVALDCMAAALAWVVAVFVGWVCADPWERFTLRRNERHHKRHNLA